MAGVVNESITRVGRYEPFDLQTARGQVVGHTPTNVFAYGTTPATAGLFRTVWENMATTDYAFPGSALTMQLVSAAAGDTATVTVNGLDASFNVVSEALVLNGTTNVPTTKQYFRVNSLTVTAGVPTGAITLSNGGTVYAQINTVTLGGSTTSAGTSQMAVYTVPAGNTLYLYRFRAYSSFNGNTANYTTYRSVLNFPSGVQRVLLQTPFNTQYEVDRAFPFGYAAGTDLRWQIASSAATAAVVGVNQGGVLVANDGSL